MEKEKTQIIALAERILAGQATDEEIHSYTEWVRQLPATKEELFTHPELKEAELLSRIRMQIGFDREEPRQRSWYRWVAAAAVVLMVGLGSFYFLAHNKETKPITQVSRAQDIAPGGSHAMLTLPGGRQVLLDEATKGEIASALGCKILKTADGTLSIQADPNKTSHELSYSTLSTPKGGQYQLRLPDGTAVWLNAASSIKFPTAFNGKTREVEITGEAYFEVSHQPTRPFIVHYGDMQVKVLGTHFDVNTYKDNGAVKTTLLEGSVSVEKKGQAVKIKPGEQAVLQAGVADIQVRTVDTDNAVAWTKGFLSMQDNDVAAFMIQLSRWYDVEVVFPSGVPEGHLGGYINRNTNLSDVLSVLEAGGIHARLEGKKVIVTP